MQTRNTLQTPTSLTPGALRLGPDHGYAFDGDQVQLNAELLGDAAGNWALQLWACDAPFDGQPVRGTKVAEVAVGGDEARVSASVPAFPPAGHAQHAMVLVLADGSDGSIRDFANFPLPEQFAQPRIQGTAGFTLGDSQVHITVDGIDNPRAADNLSGSLVVELWALPAPFGERGNTDGVQLAGVFLGSLAGQHGWQHLAFELPLAARPAGTWHVALLLREWTAAGYVTRDFTDFPLPVSWAAEAAPVAEVEPAAPATPAKKPAAKKAAPKAAPKAEAGKVSINTASEAELAAIKGLPKAVAAAIVAARPFKQVDDLLAVKGVGAKLLDKLKANLAL